MLRDKKCEGYKHFAFDRLDKNIITYKGTNVKETHLYGSTPISVKNSFSVRLIKSTKYINIGFGVINSWFRGERSIDSKDVNIIYYSGYKGIVQGD